MGGGQIQNTRLFKCIPKIGSLACTFQSMVFIPCVFRWSSYLHLHSLLDKYFLNTCSLLYTWKNTGNWDRSICIWVHAGRNGLSTRQARSDQKIPRLKIKGLKSKWTLPFPLPLRKILAQEIRLCGHALLGSVPALASGSGLPGRRQFHSQMFRYI